MSKIRVAVAAAIVATVVLVGASVGFATATAPEVTKEVADPVSEALAVVSDDGVEIVTGLANNQLCLVARAGRAHGSACTSTSATQVMVSYVVGETGFTLGVIDPQQNGIVVQVDGTILTPLLTQHSGLTYFTESGSVLPHDVIVLDSDGNKIEHVRPAEEHAATRSADEIAQGH